MRPPGALLLNWLDLEAGAEQDFELWHNREHAAERVSLPGFRRCRRYVTAEPTPAVGFGTLIAYEGDDAQAFSSADYAARLNDPTPQTAAVVPRLRNVNRALVTVRNSWRAGVGVWVCTVSIGAQPEAAEIWAHVQEVLAKPSVVELTLGVRADVADAKTGTVEQAQTDSRSTEIGAVLLVGASRPDGIEKAVSILGHKLVHLRPAIHRFQLAYLLDRVC